jgi:hypothetical protein
MREKGGVSVCVCMYVCDWLSKESRRWKKGVGDGECGCVHVYVYVYR